MGGLEILTSMDKTIEVDNLRLFYQEFGKGGNNLLLLHGWGQSHAFWKDVIKRFSDKYHIYVLDLPGFGMSEEPSMTWTIKDYALFIHHFVAKLNIDTPAIIGHSFGGRISIAYAGQFSVKKLVLYSNGGLSQKSIKKTLSRYLFSRFVIIGKYIFPNQLYKLHTVLFRPKDYRNKVIINNKKSRRIMDIYTQPFQDLTSFVKNITADTLIISGKKDFIGDPAMGARLHALIKNSRLVEIPTATHFAHLEASEVFYDAVKQFLKKH